MLPAAKVKSQMNARNEASIRNVANVHINIEWQSMNTDVVKLQSQPYSNSPTLNDAAVVCWPIKNILAKAFRKHMDFCRKRQQLQTMTGCAWK